MGIMVMTIMVQVNIMVTTLLEPVDLIM